jgi:plasmid stabilization system protein ParE
MNRPIHLSDEAEDDMAAAYTWYEDRQIGLGEAYLDEVQEVLRYAASNPFAFQAVHREFHHLPMRRFPFLIIYKIGEQDLQVYRIFHTGQNPEKWKLTGESDL